MTDNPIFITSYEFNDIIINDMVGNKLFCTFVAQDKLDKTLHTLTHKYSILYNKIFVLESPDTDEFILTYNIDVINTSSKNALPSTILLHRKKESNTLYTINALNTLIKELNNGMLDNQFKVSWNDYQNSILLTQGPDLRILNTKIYKIINI